MSHGEDDDPQLKSLRAVWLSMPDEDPPERGLDALMAAARTKATEMSAAAPVADDATPSWWQRLLAGLRRPPVLALATVVVLVAGAVLIGNRHTKLDATSPSGGARPSTEDVPTQSHTTERNYETAPPPPPAPPAPPTTPPPARHLDHKENPNSVGGAQQLAAPRDERANGVELREDDQADAKATDATLSQTKAANEGTTTKTKATTTSGAKAPKGERTVDTGRDSCSAVRAKLQGLQPADARAYRSTIASDPALAKCIAPAAEATTTAPAE